ncbi:MAG: peptidyl-prolyl cis-trans isomerase [Polyangiaceae bacterium]|nr:peptidyl-prolyl cis-trans isomerase [Polyangiaceae bacterium]
MSLVARRLALPVLLGAVGLALGPACDEKKLDASASASASIGGLPPEVASKVLARVGERTITLGDYAVTLERMDQFERLRYQSPDRRKQLLQEIIRVELLAQEARRRGLDQAPETKERVRQLLRDELLRRTRASLPAPADLPEAEVRAWYEAHRADFREPERRRVAVLVLADEAKAKKLAEQAASATPQEWGRLVRDHSLEKPAPGATAPLELAGDLGIVSAPGVDRGENPRVPEAVRGAVFEIAAVGGVLGRPVAAEGKHYVVRMTGKTDARDRSFEEAQRSIRVSILQERIRAAEAALEQELRGRFAVKVDDAALAKVEVRLEAPEAAGSAAPAPSGSAPAASAAAP